MNENANEIVRAREKVMSDKIPQNANNVDLIVRALREAPNYNTGIGTSTIEDEAADLIELQNLKPSLPNPNAGKGRRWSLSNISTEIIPGT